MNEAVGLFTLIALAVFGFGLVSRRLERSVITPPIVFVSIGLLLGPAALDIVPLGAHSEVVQLLAEITLVMVLFTDASRIRFTVLREDYAIPLRLLGIGLPLCILTGALVAKGLFGRFGWLEAAILATALAPTDAALGQAVVSNERVPNRIRQALNVESGLNDGITVPVITILLAVAGMAFGHDEPAYWLRFTAAQLILGPLVGLGVGYLGGQAISRCSSRNWMNEEFMQLATVSLALMAYAGASLVGGNGFIAAFVAGLTIGNTAHAASKEIFSFSETEGQLFSLLTFLIFGAAIAGPALEHLDAKILLYAVLSLTIVRMLPVAIALFGQRLRPMTVLFLGWFGPRGIASIIYALMILDTADMAGHDEIYAVVALSVLLSVFAHGLTAAPAAAAYGRRSEKARATPEMADAMPELQPGADLPLRLPYH